MIQIQNTIVSLDLIEKFFCCDLEACHGDCCIEGDAGAPLTLEEFEKINEILPEILPLLTPQARKVIEQEGVGYYDQEGDLVTSLVAGANCVFTTFGPGGQCLCALEQAYRGGKTDFCKPQSCHLYPVRLKQYPAFLAVNFHKWDICKAALALGRAKGLRAYQFLREPLIARFGQEWYDELDLTAREYLRQKTNNS